MFGWQLVLVTLHRNLQLVLSNKFRIGDIKYHINVVIDEPIKFELQLFKFKLKTPQRLSTNLEDLKKIPQFNEEKLLVILVMTRFYSLV